MTELLTTREVADLLKVKPGTVLEYRKAGRLSAIRLGGPRGPWRFLSDSVDRLCGVSSSRKPSPKELLEKDLRILARLGISPLP